MPRLRTIKDLFWTGRVLRCNNTDPSVDGGRLRIIYVRIDGCERANCLGLTRVSGREIGSRRVWWFEWFGNRLRCGLPWVEDVTLEGPQKIDG